jgi:hypothetical protein
MEYSYYIDCAIAEYLCDSVEKGLGADGTSTYYDRSLLAIAFWGKTDNDKWDGPGGIVEMTQPGAQGVLDAIIAQIAKYNDIQKALGRRETAIWEFTQLSLDNENKNMGMKGGLRALFDKARFHSWYELEYKPKINGICV